MNLTTGQKATAVGIIAAIAGTMGYVATQLTDCVGKTPVDPAPEVSSSPTPSSSPTSSPLPSFSPSPLPSSSPSATPSAPSGGGLVLKGVVGETVSAMYVSTVPITALPVGVRAFEVMKVTTLVPSYRGAAVGAWEDPLKPVTALEAGKRYWVEATVVLPQTTQLSFVTLIGKPGPMKTMPMYMELQTRQAMLAHGLADSVTTQCPIGNKYASLLRAHGVEPIKQFILGNPQVLNGKLNLDGNWPEYGCDFRTSVLKGAIAPPMIFTWSPAASDALIAATKASLADLPTDAWAYNWDEGEPAMDAQSLAQAIRYKASGLKLMQTHQVTAAFAPYIDWFCPVVNYAPLSGNPACLYTSCMAQGNCQPQTLASVAPASGHPMMVLDAPTGHAVAFPLLVAKLGAKMGLYFNSTQKLPTAWTPGGQYSEGGNGDGTLLYPGTDGNPWPSLRLKRVYRGMQDAWYLSKGMVNPVQGPTSFPQDEAAYETARLAAWEKL